jgi:ABC-type proline/glycine betaine transport system permease subunit
LNNIIIENPEKSLTILLLNKDIENIKKENELQIELIKDKVETVVDLNKWILGLIFSLLITIVISNLAKNKSKNNLEE